MIKKEIESKEKLTYVCIPKKFREDFFGIGFDKDIMNEPKLVLQVLFKIISDLSKYNYQPREFGYIGPDNQQKLELWQNEFLGKDRSIIIRYNISEFLQNRDKRKMKNILIFLKLFRIGEYSFQNYKGETISTYGGLIKDFLFAEKSGNFEIEISQYWATRIVEKVNYNKLYNNVVNALKNNKQILFVLWLIEFGEFETSQGKQYTSTVLYTTLQENFNLNYNSCYDLCRNWLLPIKTKLDNFDEGYSFQFKIDEKNKNKITFIRYEIKPKNKNQSPDDLIQKKEVNINSISYKVTYLKRRHSLSNDNSKKIKEIIKEDYYLFEKNYKRFLKDCSQNKLKAVDYLDDKFIEKFKEYNFESI